MLREGRGALAVDAGQIFEGSYDERSRPCHFMLNPLIRTLIHRRGREILSVHEKPGIQEKGAMIIQGRSKET